MVGATVALDPLPLGALAARRRKREQLTGRARTGA